VYHFSRQFFYVANQGGVCVGQDWGLPIFKGKFEIKRENNVKKTNNFLLAGQQVW